MSDSENDFVDDGRFRPGNQLWKMRSKNGRNRLFPTPEILWSECIKYFQWVEDNPLFEAKPFSFQGSSWIEPIPKMRAMTKDGLRIFLNISIQTWEDYKKRPDFIEVCDQVEEVIRQQKFEGAAADLLNASIVSRDLGLADKIETKAVTMEISKDATPQDAANAYKTMMGL